MTLFRESADPALIRRFPREFLLSSAVVPLREEDGVVVVVGAPEARGAAEEIGSVLEKPVRFTPGDPRDIRRFVTEKYDAGGGGRQEAIDELEREGRDVRELEELANEAPVVRLVGAVLQAARERGASDVHIEPHDDESVIRFRVDGVLAEHDRLPRGLHRGVVSRIKIMSRLDIAQTRLPQDGRITVTSGGKELDLRVSTIPTPQGERVVLRLLERGSVRRGLGELGFTESLLPLWHDLLANPHGIILVTGPTGSGKTTTLYAALDILHTGKVNILTVEDPVEYQIEGIGQIQVNPKINLTFASGLRAILRQDPDVIMVGEIRDEETAVIAVQSALTGHLVLSTLHTNDAPSALPRLVDMGAEPYLLASSVRGVLAQRLVRRLCPHCRRSRAATREEAAWMGADHVGVTLYDPGACEHCAGVGFRGRTGLFELMPVTDALRPLIMQKASASALRQAAAAEGFHSLREDGRRVVAAGITTIAEVVRVTEDI